MKKIIAPESGNTLGLLVCKLDNTEIKKNIEESLLQRQTRFTLISSNEKFTLTNGTLQSKNSRWKSKLFTSKKTSDKFGFTVTQQVPTSKIFRNTLVLIIMITLMFIIVFFITRKIVDKLCNRLIYPLSNLENYAELVGHGKHLPPLELSNFSEINSLNQAFNKMMTDIEILKSKIYVAQEEKNMNDLEFMQKQINPHFLYNSLDTILAFNKDNNIHAANKMIYFLSDYYQKILNSGSSFILIENELEMLQSYINIQKLKSDIEFEYSVEVDQALLKEKILKMIIQPILENTFLHGFYNLERKGKIELVIERNKDEIMITINDNGVGFDVKKTFEKETNFGLNSIIKRLKLQSGVEAKMQILSTINVGTSVQIWYPLLHKE